MTRSLVSGVILFCVATLIGCSETSAEYQKPKPEQTRGSAHPALAEDVKPPLPTSSLGPHGSNPHGASPHGGALPAGHPPTGGAAGRSPTGGMRGLPVPADWKEGDEFEAAGVVAKSDGGWKRVPTKNSLRLAQFVLPRVESDSYDAEMWVSQAAGGDWTSNLNRWRAAFEDLPEPTIAEPQVPGMEVKVVRLSGTYKYTAGAFGTPPEPRGGYTMLVAMIDEHLFFRLIGPNATVQKWQGSFQSMIDRLRPAR